MSWLPIYNAFLIMFVILSCFLWEVLGLFFVCCFGVVSLIYLVKESVVLVKHYAFAFWLFIFSEVMIFGTLFVVCIWSEEDLVSAISEYTGLPLLGCFLLTGSSITVTTYHHYLGCLEGRPFLLMTLFLGSGFAILQLCEFYECGCDLTFCVYQAVCFCTVGLHFSHVLLGMVGLVSLFFLGDTGVVSRPNIDFVVWYWHFVDYIWLFVFLIIYMS